MSLILAADFSWHKGQVLAFSGLDGQTCYDTGLAGRTIESPCGIEIRDPGFCRVRFGVTEGARAIFAGDFFEINGGDACIRGAFVQSPPCAGD